MKKHKDDILIFIAFLLLMALLIIMCKGNQSYLIGHI